MTYNTKTRIIATLGTILAALGLVLSIADRSDAQVMVVPNYDDPNLQEAWDWTCYHPEDTAWEVHGFGEVLAVLDAKATCHGEFWMLNGVHLWDETRHPGGPNAGDTLNEWMLGGSVNRRSQQCEDYGGTPIKFLGIVICTNEDF